MQLQRPHSPWNPHPESEALLARFIAVQAKDCPPIEALAGRLLEGCSVRLRDVIDHGLCRDQGLLDEFAAHGWRALDGGTLRHPGGWFPDIVRADAPGIAVRVASVDHFLAVTGADARIEGPAWGPYRRARIATGSGNSLWVVERNGHTGYDLPTVPAAQIRAGRVHLQRFRARRRQFDTVPQGLARTEALVDAAVAELGPHWACDLFFRAEREYWEARCEAGRLQHARQQTVGIGWSNVDHHTYDASRQHFAATIRILEKLGYECRELLYAGHQAGWGSQILEQPVLRSTIFADIDLAPHELDIDFAHMTLAPLERHRRAGLWCAMHGESMLEAGLNHVAGLYDQRVLRAQLAALGTGMMAPFSDFPVLFQQLSDGQWWAVDPERVDRLELEGHIDAAAAEDFRTRGAIAAHFENIERNDGFKGFNQPGIDDVLSILDPRRNVGAGEQSAPAAR
jgi:hypothetical protein